MQIRSHVYEQDTPQPSNPKRIRKAGEVYGYQCEIAPAEGGVSGNFWDEGRNTKWHDDFAKKPEAAKASRTTSGTIIASWPKATISALGSTALPVPTSRQDRRQRLHRPASSRHQERSGPYKVRWKNIRIRELKPDEKVQ